MNWNQLEGQWSLMSGQVRAKWHRLTEDDLRLVAGKREVLVGKLRERYGFPTADAELQVNEWAARAYAPGAPGEGSEGAIKAT